MKVKASVPVVLATRLAAIAFTIALFLPPAPAPAQTAFRPIAVVNDSAITGYDLQQRAQILVVLGYNPQNEQALRSEALDRLIEDRLKLQAGQEIGISPSPELISAGLDLIAQQSQVKSDEFLATMSAQGVSKTAVEDYVSAEAVWIQVVRARFAGRVEPSEAEVEAEMDLIRKRQAFDYRLREIGLPLTADGRTAEQTAALAEQLVASLNAGGDFGAAVAEYSRAPSAGRQGDVGWVSGERLPPEIVGLLSELEIGQVTQPVPIPAGLTILQLADKRQASRDTVEDVELRERVRNRLVNVKSNRLAEGLLQELRRDALIEIR